VELVQTSVPKLDYLYGDRERIGQIIANLLINAVKYTDRGHVRMDAVEEDGNLVISVEDTASVFRKVSSRRCLISSTRACTVTVGEWMVPVSDWRWSRTHGIMNGRVSLMESLR
jgi:light-regulated signal transduction histidine kinase (bacteriophytochrome)